MLTWDATNMNGHLIPTDADIESRYTNLSIDSNEVTKALVILTHVHRERCGNK